MARRDIAGWYGITTTDGVNWRAVTGSHRTQRGCYASIAKRLLRQHQGVRDIVWSTEFNNARPIALDQFPEYGLTLAQVRAQLCVPYDAAEGRRAWDRTTNALISRMSRQLDTGARVKNLLASLGITAVVDTRAP